MLIAEFHASHLKKRRIDPSIEESCFLLTRIDHSHHSTSEGAVLSNELFELAYATLNTEIIDFRREISREREKTIEISAEENNLHNT